MNDKFGVVRIISQIASVETDIAKFVKSAHLIANTLTPTTESEDATSEVWKRSVAEQDCLYVLSLPSLTANLASRT